MFLFLYTIATAIGLSVVDGFMESVAATDVAVFAVSFLFALYCMNDDVKLKNEN